tara:strand:- start:21483 stop:22796 length:1314 start_codon:yes stop_codon:yes gene_type:complete
MKTTQNLAYYLIGLVISPLMTFLIAIKNYNSIQKKYSKTIFILFTALFGVFITLAEGADGFRHVMNVNGHYLNLDFYSFLVQSKDLLFFRYVDGANEELFLHFVSYFTSLFGGSQSLFFCIVSTFYAYFYFSAIINVYDYIPKNKGFFVTLLFILFVLWKSLEGINTVGTWVAFWVFFHGAFGYFKTKKNRYLFFIIASCFIHHSFYLFTISFWIFYFFGNRPKLYLIILTLSIGVNYSSISTASFANIFSINKLSQSKLNTYSLLDSDKQIRYDEKMLEKSEKANFLKFYYTKVSNLWAQVSLFLIAFRYNYWSKKINNSIVNGSLCIAILVWSFGNLLSFVPAIYNRGMVVSGVFILISFIILILDEKGNKLNFVPKANNIFKLFKVLSFPIFILVVISKFSSLFQFLNFKLFFPLLLSPFIEDDSINSILKIFL